MTKDGCFSDFYESGNSTWVFEPADGLRPSVTITAPESNGVFHVGDSITVTADIRNLANAKLTLNIHKEQKDNLESQRTVSFTAHELTGDDIGDITIKVEGSSPYGLMNSIANVQIQIQIKEGLGDDNYFVGGTGTSNLPVRPSPSRTSGEVAKFAPGTKIKIVLPKTIQKEESTGAMFIQVYYDGDKMGWVSTEYVFPDKPIEFLPPVAVSGNYNENPITLNPQSNWGPAGVGGYTGQSLKENGRYRVAVVNTIKNIPSK